MIDKSFLVAGGCARSGTTALAKALNAHPDIFLGSERYLQKFRKGTIEVEDFEKEKFLSDLSERDAGDAAPLPERIGKARFENMYDDVGAAYDRARFIGDKVPALGLTYDYLFDRFPGIRVVYIVRNPISVTESYEARRADADDRWNRSAKTAIREWNNSVSKTLECLRAGRPITVVSYEELFSSLEAFGKLFGALGLDIKDADQAVLTGLVEEYNESIVSKARERDESLRRQIALQADIASYRRIVRNHCILSGKLAESRVGARGQPSGAKPGKAGARRKSKLAKKRPQAVAAT
ncbi:sulfotransferase family protein [Tropicimonas isoalkanivorans]|uniref:Sulfotransferase family protein n=1 Tax=Tropicimonas isoalkanivorans TaxID=441112 RepID=A0A1I1QPM3_9RHOB|nr:sulfotransferase [Tropicimonas isoalkanivorans]SFD24061.1 Sulfotransferase family protein [Tropicimonas isoalkanivorans]